MTERNRLTTVGWRVRLRLASDHRLVALVRRDDGAAFEAVYERYSAELLSFCTYMLDSRHDAEDAVQATFVAAYRALRSDRRQITLRPWLLTVARNNCLSILRGRRPTVELNSEPALRGDPLRELELRDEVRRMLEGVRELPEGQRVVLILAELHGLSHVEIGQVLGIRTEQVKAHIYQARSNLISDRQARDADCREIREELANARGAALLRGRLRRHMRSCADCRVYAEGVALQRRQLGALLPLAPSLVLKHRALQDALGVGAADPATYAGGAAVEGSAAVAAVEVAGSGIKALAVKIAAGVAVLGAGAGVGVSTLGTPITPERQTKSIAARPTRAALAASLEGTEGGAGTPANSGQFRVGRLDRHPSASTTAPRLRGADSNQGLDPSVNGSGDPTRERGSGRQRRGHSTAEHPSKHEQGRPPTGENRGGKSRKHPPASEEHQRSGQEHTPKSEEQHLKNQHERELRASQPPPKTEEQRQQAHEDREQQHIKREEHKQGG